MRSTLLYRWEALRTSYWFLPGLLVLMAIGLAIGFVELDVVVHKEVRWLADWTYSGSAEGARAVLATIAGSMITVAGVVFSITIVALSLASNQFGPRILRNFMRDRRNQMVLGVFTATYLYCLLVLRTVRGTDSTEFVPGISVTLGIVLAVASLGVLIYFIHHVAVSIQAAHVIQAVTEELNETIDRLWPERLGKNPPENGPPPEHDLAQAAVVKSPSSGYVDAINDELLMSVACQREVVIRLAQRPGRFAVAGTPLAWVWPREACQEETSQRLAQAFTFAPQRTPFQDVEFAVSELVEVAVRALSPGVNDPFTAIICIDRLGEALCQLAEREIPSPLRYDDQGHLRVIAHRASFRAVVDAAFHQIRQYGASSPAILTRLLETMTTVAGQAQRPEDRSALMHHAALTWRAAQRSVADEADLADIRERLEALERLVVQRREEITSDVAELAAGKESL